MDKLPSYSKIYNLGHRALRDFFDGHAIEVTEKVDGSQFSFAMIDGELHFRSKGAVILKDAPGMFEAGVRSICERASGLTEGWIYRGEYLSKPKHNALAYDSIPKGHVILFGIDLTMGGQDYVSHNFLAAEARRLDLEVVPLLGYVHQPDMEWLNETLETESVLGGQKIEGIVMKNYRRFDQDGKVLMAKFVSEKFKEVHQRNWKAENPAHADILEILGNELCTEARWIKAVMHLEELGELEESPRDIGKLIGMVQKDVHDEERDYIADKLFRWAWKKHLSRATTRGLPEWYKRYLAERQFGRDQLPDDHPEGVFV